MSAVFSTWNGGDLVDDDLSNLRRDLAALREELVKQGTMTAVLEQRLKTLEDDLNKAIARGEQVATQYVPVMRYAPVEKILYGMVGLILVSFMGALIALVVK